MQNLDQDKIQPVIQDAFKKVAGNRRWEIAIVKARRQLESNPYMHFDGAGLLVLSESGEIYRANGTCQCKAFEPSTVLASRDGKISSAIQRKIALKQAR